jgi:hypothetical protein
VELGAGFATLVGEGEGEDIGGGDDTGEGEDAGGGGGGVTGEGKDTSECEGDCDGSSDGSSDGIDDVSIIPIRSASASSRL